MKKTKIILLITSLVLSGLASAQSNQKNHEMFNEDRIHKANAITLDYTQKDKFWNPTFYAKNKIEFNGCEVRVDSYYLDIQNIPYLDVFDDKVRFVLEDSVTVTMDKNEKDKFIKEYIFRRSICSFRRSFE